MWGLGVKKPKELLPRNVGQQALSPWSRGWRGGDGTPGSLGPWVPDACFTPSAPEESGAGRGQAAPGKWRAQGGRT